MATPVQANLEAKNKEYAAKFTKGSLALPPAKHYTVGKYHIIILQGDSDRLPRLHLSALEFTSVNLSFSPQ